MTVSSGSLVGLYLLVHGQSGGQGCGHQLCFPDEFLGCSYSFSAHSLINNNVTMRTIKYLPVTSKCNNGLKSVIKCRIMSKFQTSFMLHLSTPPLWLLLPPSPPPWIWKGKGHEVLTWLALLECGMVLSRLSGQLQLVPSLIRVCVCACVPGGGSLQFPHGEPLYVLPQTQVMSLLWMATSTFAHRCLASPLDPLHFQAVLPLGTPGDSRPAASVGFRTSPWKKLAPLIHSRAASCCHTVIHHPAEADQSQSRTSRLF